MRFFYGDNLLGDTVRLVIRARWMQLIGTTIGVTALASAASLVASTILLRVLPLQDAGHYALLSTLVDTTVLIGGLGQSSLILRLYSQQPIGYYDWRHDLVLVTLVTLPAIVAISLIAVDLYSLDRLPSLFLLLAALAASLILCISGILNSQGHYQWGNVLLRFRNGLLLLPATIIFLVLPWRRLDFALGSQLLTYLLTGGIGLFLLQRKTSRGDGIIHFRQIGQGLTFVAAGSSAVIADQVLLSVAGLTVSAPELAAFVALNVLFSPVQLLQNVLSKVLVTEFARAKAVNYQQRILQMGLACALLVVLATVVLPLVAHWFYAGRYDWAIFLIFWLGLANSLDLAEVIPRSYLFGCAPTKLLNWFIFAQVMIAALGLGAGIILIAQYGILGVALGGVVIFVLRLITSYTFFWRSLSAK